MYTIRYELYQNLGLPSSILKTPESKDRRVSLWPKSMKGTIGMARSLYLPRSKAKFAKFISSCPNASAQYYGERLSSSLTMKNFLLAVIMFMYVCIFLLLIPISFYLI